MWRFSGWSYAAPTTPPTLVLDTRTQRAYDSDEGAARLIGAPELDRVRGLAEAAGVPEAGNVLLVSPVPVFGLELQERRQKFLAGKVGPYEIDFEAWHSALGGLVDLMRLLIDDLGLRRCVVLSGDVHYGLTVDATFVLEERPLRIAQLVSSAVKHSGVAARTALDLLGRSVRPGHARAGWEDEPDLDCAAPGVVRRLLRRPANNDEWSDGGPVLLPPTVADRVAPDDPPSFREERAYVRPEERASSFLVGESNMGLVTVDGDRVVHVMWGRLAGANRPHTTVIDLALR
jgi:hypothetical protein